MTTRSSARVKPPVPRSADLQSAVSPNCIRQTARKSRRRLENPAARRIANPRYSRLKICTTFLAGARAFRRGVSSMLVLIGVAQLNQNLLSQAIEFVARRGGQTFGRVG